MYQSKGVAQFTKVLTFGLIGIDFVIICTCPDVALIANLWVNVALFSSVRFIFGAASCGS